MTTTTPLHQASAATLVRLVRSRKIGCLELADHYIDRIERLDAQINAVVVRDFDVARERARRLDSMSATELSLMPLAGVPATVKESFDLRGHPTTLGLTQHAVHRATDNALAVSRLIHAGAVVLGKTNVPVHLADWQSFNPVYGTTNNPWDLARTPGGSSGGSAAALAAGFSAIEIGSDIGASIRNPAHYCGVYGHKPTWGIASRMGHGAPGTTAESDIAVIGPLARSAQDLETVLSVIARPDPIDGQGWRVNLPRPLPAHLRDYRVAVMVDDVVAPVDASVRAAVASVGEYLERQGATVSYVARPGFSTAEANELYLLMLRATTSGQATDETLRAMRQVVEQAAVGDTSYPTMLARGATLSHRDYLAANERRHQMRRAWAHFFQDWDVLICPVAATEAFPQNQQGQRWERMIDVNGGPQPSTTQLFWAGYSGLFYLPSTVVPVASGPAGLPIGVQIVTAQYHDLTALDLAARLERGQRGFIAPPAFA